MPCYYYDPIVHPLPAYRADDKTGAILQEAINRPNIPLQEKSQGDFTGPQKYF